MNERHFMASTALEEKFVSSFVGELLPGWPAQGVLKSRDAFMVRVAEQSAEHAIISYPQLTAIVAISDVDGFYAIC